LAPHSGNDSREPGWRYLISSDGLTDMLPMSAIEAELDLADPFETVSRLYTAAMDAGGKDNISIILVSWCEGSLEKPHDER
jgi:serine/threonine protein phosphatase PrpC